MAQIPHLRRYAHALTGDRVRGDDLVQDCLERAWSRRRLYRPERPIRPWLFTILHNLYVNEARRHAARPAMLSPDHPSAAALPAPAEPGAIEAEDLRRALIQLSPQHREVLLLVGLEQLSYREAAQCLAVPVGTVMSRLARARAHLRELLDGAEYARLRRVK